jgi:hypothetical protein
VYANGFLNGELTIPIRGVYLKIYIRDIQYQ